MIDNYSKNKKLIVIIFFLYFSNTIVFASNRIISLIPSSTEFLFALGFADEVIAVSNYCNYPEEETSKLPKIGDQNLNLERIISLKPSILIDTNGIHKKYYKTFKQLKLNYINLEIKSQSDIPIVANTLGNILGNKEKVKDFIDKWNQEIESLKKIPISCKPNTYLEIWNNPIQTVGGDTNINSILEIAGGENIFQNQKDYPIVNSEMILIKNPEIVILIYPNPDYEAIKRRPGWGKIKAVKNNHIFYINQDILVRPGPRNIEAIKAINLILNKVMQNEKIK